MVLANNAKKLSSPYSKITRKLTGNIEQMIEMGISPEEVAYTILKAVRSNLHYPAIL